MVLPALVHEVKLIWRKFQDPAEASKGYAAYVAYLPFLCQGSKWLNGKSV